MLLVEQEANTNLESRRKGKLRLLSSDVFCT